jgi:hypothetical protein
MNTAEEISKHKDACVDGASAQILGAVELFYGRLDPPNDWRCSAPKQYVGSARVYVLQYAQKSLECARLGFFAFADTHVIRLGNQRKQIVFCQVMANFVSHNPQLPQPNKFSTRRLNDAASPRGISQAGRAKAYCAVMFSA